MTIELMHVTQPTPHTCVHACLSMVTAIPVENLIQRFGNHGLGDDVTLTVLTEMGIYPMQMPYGHEDPIIMSGAYLVTVPSLNVQGRNHSVVVYVSREGDYQVYDPNFGRDGAEAYPQDALSPSSGTKHIMHGRSDVTLLRSLEKHKGSQERQSLYIQRRELELSGSDRGDDNG